MSTKVPPPQTVAAPYRPDVETEPTTGEYEIAASHEAPTAVLFAKQSASKNKRELTLADVKWYFATLATIGVFLFSAAGWASDYLKGKIDGGVVLLAREISSESKRNDQQDAELKEHGVALRRVELEQVRASTMLENLSRASGLPVPPKVALDGGE